MVTTAAAAVTKALCTSLSLFRFAKKRTPHHDINCAPRTDGRPSYLSIYRLRKIREV